MIHVIAAITIAPGKRDDFIRAFKELTPKVHAEDGCIEYGATIDAETPISAQIPARSDVVVVVEKWESVPALEAHLAAPHMDEFRMAMGDAITDLLVSNAGLALYSTDRVSSTYQDSGLHDSVNVCFVSFEK